MTRRRHILLLVALLAGGMSATGQTERKVTHREEPDYPELAKKMNLHGMVKLVIVGVTQSKIGGELHAHFYTVVPPGGCDGRGGGQ